MQSTADIKRIQAIDFTRGLALLGILIINIQTFALFFILVNPEQVYALKLDKPETYIPVNFAIKFLAEGQFYTMYSFLFGLGFYLLLEKYKRLGLNGGKLFKRRLWVLLFIGLVHGLLFWFGDVLHKYALLGFTLLYFNKKSLPAILKWIAGLATFVIIFNVMKYSFFVTETGIAKDNQQLAELGLTMIRTWQHGSFLEVQDFQKIGVLVGHIFNAVTGFFFYIHYEIMFLLGLITGKIGLLNNISQYRPMLKRAVLYILPAALLLKGLSCLTFLNMPLFRNAVHQEFAFTILQFISVPPLTISYLILILLLFPEKPTRFSTWIANTGRLGLTNYLGQSLICMILFYGYGFGLAGKLTLMETTGVGFLIYITQVIYSNIWLRYFVSGPMENVWLRLTMYKNYRVNQH